jgi:hypothetical protein
MTRLFAEADPDRSRGGEVPIREVLDRGRDRLATELADEPSSAPAVPRPRPYHKLGLLMDAEGLYREAPSCAWRSWPGRAGDAQTSMRSRLVRPGSL